MDIWNSIISAITGGPVIALLVLLAANLVLSLIAAIQKGTFNLAKLSDFIPKRLWPFLAYVVVALLAQAVAEFAAVAVVVYVGLVSLYVKGILAAVKSITGLAIPDVISEKLKE